MARLGFFDLTSLLVFANPFSPHEQVRSFLLGTDHSLEAIKAAASMMQTDAALDFGKRLTAILHERQHFHDLVLTRYGARLVREHLHFGFNAFLLARGEGEHRARMKAPLVLPISSSEVSDPVLVQTVRALYSRCRLLVERCRMTLECSAMLVQRLAAYDILGLDAFQLMEDHAKKLPLIYRLSSIFDRYAEILDKAHPEFSALGLLRLVIMTALNDDYPDRYLAMFAKWLKQVVKEQPPPTVRSQLLKMANLMIGAQSAATPEIMRENIDFTLKFIEAARGDKGCEPITDALINFDTVSTEARKDYIEHLVPYLHAAEEVDICTPHVFWFAERKDKAFIKREDAEKIARECHEDLFGFRVFGESEVAEVQICPASHLLIPGQRQFNRELWTAIAKTLPGAQALFSGIDWDNPLQSYWLREVVQGGWGIEVRRAQSYRRH